jgi:hypothetical protein
MKAHIQSYSSGHLVEKYLFATILAQDNGNFHKFIWTYLEFLQPFNLLLAHSLSQKGPFLFSPFTLCKTHNGFLESGFIALLEQDFGGWSAILGIV